MMADAEQSQREAFSRFDFRAVLTYTGYDDRIEGLYGELNRVGLGDARVFWQIDSPFYSRLLSTLKTEQSGVGAYSCTLGHYRILKTALALGYEHALVLEDDVRMLKDHRLLAEIVSTLPDDYDFAKFEWHTWGRWTESWVDDRVRSSTLTHWIDGNGILTCGAGMCAYSRRGMQRKIEMIESACDTGKMPIIDQIENDKRFFADGIKTYLAVPLAGIQIMFEKKMHGGARYRRMLKHSRDMYGD